MFYYYGRKKMLARRYPPPEHPVIVEPFAGSAAYSLHGDHWERDVILCDRSALVIGIWRYLQQASRADILALPDPPEGTDIRRTFTSLSRAELDLIGLHTGQGKPTRRSVVSKFSRWGAGRRYIADNIHKVRRWKVHHCSFGNCPYGGPATWFIDPPYQHAGVVYRAHDTLDFLDLAKFVATREGTVIVCGDYDRDTWLPFDLIGETKSAGTRTSREGVYVRRAEVEALASGAAGG